MKIKVIKNGIYSVDVENTKNQKLSGISYVLTVKKLKTRPFGKSTWMVKQINPYSPMESNNEFAINENQLSLPNAYMVRFPNNMPIINDMDIDCIKVLIDRLKKTNYEYLSHGDKMLLNRAEAVYDKLCYYNSMYNL